MTFRDACPPLRFLTPRGGVEGGDPPLGGSIEGGTPPWGGSEGGGPPPGGGRGEASGGPRGAGEGGGTPPWGGVPGGGPGGAKRAKKWQTKAPPLVGKKPRGKSLSKFGLAARFGGGSLGGGYPAPGGAGFLAPPGLVEGGAPPWGGSLGGLIWQKKGQKWSFFRGFS